MGCDCNGNKYLLCLCCYCCHCCNVRNAEEEIKEELEKNQVIEMKDMDKRAVQVNTSSPVSTLSVEPNTTMRSFAKPPLKKRTSGTATVLSSTCKTASGRPDLVDRVRRITLDWRIATADYMRM